MQGDIKLKIRNIEKLILHKAVLPAMYNLHKHKPVNEKLVLFANAKHGKVPFSMQAMYEAMQQEGYQVETWCVDFDTLALKNKLQYLYQFMKRYAEAKYVFICDYFLPTASCDKRDETKVVQLWHAGGMLKKFGYDAADDLGNLHGVDINKNINLWTVSAEACVPVYEKATGLYDGQVQALGIARTDIYFSEQYREACVERFYQQYPELKDKKMILWAPTFRNNAKTANLIGLEDIKRLQKDLGEEWHILMKLHPHLVKRYGVDNCEIPIEQLYPVVDLLITDYSSALFDYSLFQKPFLIYALDYDDYIEQRGCYLDMKTDLPCDVVTKYENLLKVVQQFTTYVKYDFKELFMQCCDGNAIEQIMHEVGAYGNDVDWKSEKEN